MAWNDQLEYVNSDGEIKKLPEITAEDIRMMSLSDYSVYRTYLYDSQDAWGRRVSSHEHTFTKYPEDIRAEVIPVDSPTVFDVTNEPELGIVLTDTNTRNRYTPNNGNSLSLLPVPDKKELTYVQHYWNYIDATDGVVAAEALSDMLDKVTMGLEPVGSSWVAERETKLEKTETRYRVPPIIYVIFVITVISVLYQLGIL